jgi:DNA repair ATPase RecN
MKKKKTNHRNKKKIIKAEINELDFLNVDEEEPEELESELMNIKSTIAEDERATFRRKN